MSIDHLIAGVTGGLASTIILHPLDLLKIRFAVSDGRSNLKKSYKGIRNACFTIFKEEGITGFYKGLTPNCIGSGMAWGLYFLFYESFKDQIIVLRSTTNPTEPLGLGYRLVAGMCAGAVTTTITNPIWVVKTRLCLQYGPPLNHRLNTVQYTPELNRLNKEYSLPEIKRYSGPWDALKKICRHEGILGLYRGYIPGLFGVLHGAIQVTAYEEMKKLFTNHYNFSEDHEFFRNSICAGSSKLLAASITYPYQVIRARLQDQYVNYNGTIDVIFKIWKYESFRGFYKGLSPSLARVIPASIITFVVYEQVLHYRNL